MHRRLKRNIKTGSIILIFSTLVTCLLAGTLLWFGSQSYQVQDKNGGVYLLSPTEYKDVVNNKGAMQLDAGNLLGTKRYQADITNQLLTNLFPISIIFLITLCILSFCLWLFLKHIQTKNMLKIAEELHESMTDTVLSDEPVLAIAYANLKEEFDNRLNDFKRFSAYLTHEQKNEVAILRTRMELAGDTKNIEKLDDIAYSIDDILTLSENTDAIPQAIVDVSIICAEVFDTYRKTTNNLYFEFDGEDDTEIYAKTRWIYRAVANLLDNAIKYGEDKPITLSVRSMHNSVIVQVSDHGIGISSDKQEKIFDERYRVNELNKDGYGIGLSLVSHVCDLCGGYVMVDSEIEKGSTFYMSFPQKLF